MPERPRARYTRMANMQPIHQAFHEGDEVVLVEGTYQGTLGVFVRLKKDLGWADITERNGDVRSHPVAWLGHVRPAAGNRITEVL
jgi:hypothetical protein